jgi:hypothetical protein
VTLPGNRDEYRVDEERVAESAVAEVETMVEPDRILNDDGWKPVSFVEIGRWVHVGMAAQTH